MPFMFQIEVSVQPSIQYKQTVPSSNSATFHCKQCFGYREVFVSDWVVFILVETPKRIMKLQAVENEKCKKKNHLIVRSMFP